MGSPHSPPLGRWPSPQTLRTDPHPSPGSSVAKAGDSPRESSRPLRTGGATRAATVALEKFLCLTETGLSAACLVATRNGLCQHFPGSQETA